MDSPMRGWVSEASEAWHAVCEAIANIGDGLAKIGDGLRGGKGVLWLGLICTKDALERNDLSEVEKRFLTKQATSFQAHVSEIINSSDKCSKDAALGAADDALMIVARGGKKDEGGLAA
jgi:hypothetical protein